MTRISGLFRHINLNRFKVMFHLFSGSALWTQLLSIIHIHGYYVMADYYSLGPTEVSWGCGGGVLNTLILIAARKHLIVVR